MRAYPHFKRQQVQRSWEQEEAVNSRDKGRSSEEERVASGEDVGSEGHLKYVLGGHVRIYLCLKNQVKLWSGF